MKGKSKTERQQVHKLTQRKAAKRKAKVYKNHILAYRRQIDRARRARQRREQREHTQQRQRQFKFRVRVVGYYQQLRNLGGSEREAVAWTYEKYQPQEGWHLALSPSTIRHWVRQVKQAGGHYHPLRPKSRRPQRIIYQVSAQVVGIIFTWRHQFGWGGHRIAAELQRRGMAHLSGRTVYTLLDRLGLPVKPYALKGRSDGIAYRRYEKIRPNLQWHMDLKETHLADGPTVYIAVILDDYSRYVLAAVAGLAKTSTWTATVVQQAVDRAGQPPEIVTDNGREFVSAWEGSVTPFGQRLLALDIHHRPCAPYYPQGNGKAEAFIKTLDRELLSRDTFDTLENLQVALDQFLRYYNNYRGHSSLGWQAPVTRFAGRTVTVRGLAALPGLEPMAGNPAWGPSYCDPPVPITPTTVEDRTALVLRLA